MTSIVFGVYRHARSSRFSGTQYFSHSFIKATLAPHCEKAHYGNERIFFQEHYKIKHAHLHRPAIWKDPESLLVILADARLFNRKTLLSQLHGSSGFADASVPDSALIVYAYRQWGEACVEKLVGDFAFAIYDPKEEKLFLAADPTGQRCFFYARTDNGNFCFANVIKPLLDIGNIPSDLNESKIADFFSLLTADIHHTFFKNIQRLPPGHSLRWKKYSHEPHLTRYWSAEKVMQQGTLAFASREHYYSAFRDLYETILSEQLVLIDSPVGCHLSGGLDSSSVTALSASLLKQQNKSLVAFAHVPSLGSFRQPILGWDYDDRSYIEEMRAHYDNLSLLYVQDNEKDLFEYNQELHPWLDYPCTNPTNVLWFMRIVEEANRLNINTILTGVGGNLTISWGGYPESMASKISLPRKIKRQLRQLQERCLQWRLGQSTRAPWGYFSAISSELASRTKLLARYEAQSFLTGHQVGIDPRIGFLDKGFLSNLPSFHTAIRFLYGIEHWDPTLDQRMIEFSLRLPNSIFKNEHRSRVLVREGLKDFLPERVCHRTSIGMQAADWYKKIERQKWAMEQLLESWKKTGMHAYINLDALVKALRRWDYEKIAKSQHKAYHYYEHLYHIKLLRAIEIGLFVQQYRTV